jgi:CelD/BcsL family acetyltransferase involved in cellulose biosynthesis
LPDCDVISFDGLHKKYLPKSFEIRLETVCLYFNIESFSTIDDYTKTVKKSFVSDYLRTTKRLIEKYGQISTHFYSSNEMETALNQLDKMLEIHRKRWPKAYKMPHFHANLLKEGLINQVLLFAETSAGNQPVAWYICFIYKEKLMFYMPAIVPEFQVYSPGKINLLACVNYAVENQLKIVDHLRGDESYKRIWANRDDLVYDVEMHSKALISRIKRMLLNLKKKFLK